MYRRRTVEDLINQHHVVVLAMLAEIKEMLVATQADVDALTGAVNTLVTTLAGDVTAINGEIAKLESQIAGGGSVDLSGLQAAVKALSSTVDTATAIVPPTPA